MKLTTTTFTATLALFASAANSANVKSTSFRLALVSADHTYNGLALTSCHLSSGYEVLCPGAAASSNPPYSSYNLNGTTSNPNVGTLTWELPGNGGPDILETMHLGEDVTAKVESAFFGGGSAAETIVGFDSNNKLYLPSTTESNKLARKLYPWHVCSVEVQGSSGSWEALSKAVDKKVPQGAKCSKVDVVRTFD